jgi:hypothetical protein
MAKPPPYPPKSSGRTMTGPKKKGLKHPSFAGSDTEPYNVRPQKPKPKPKPKKNLGKMVGKARDMKVDPMDYVRPSRAGGKAIGKKPYPPKDSPPRRQIPKRPIPKRPYDGRMTDPKPPSRITGPFKGGPSRIIKPFKGPKTRDKDILRMLLAKKKKRA